MDYYEELGLPRHASPEQIRHAWRSLARLLHPDQQQDEALRVVAEREMKRLNGICAVLTDPASRCAYDRTLAGAVTRPSRRKRWLAAAGCTALAAIAICPLLLPAPGSLPPAPPQSSQAQPGPPPPKQRARRSPRNERVRTAARRSRLDSSLPLATPLQLLVPASVHEAVQAAPEHDSERQTPSPSTPAPASENPQVVPALAAGRAAPDPAGEHALAGAWLYVPRRFPAAGRLLYPPEFIELFIAGDDGTLRGRYRARYKVEDRAISPDVLFSFEGPAVASTLPWSGAGDASGDVSLRLLSPNTLEVSWKATRMGPALGLASGTAILTRRIEQQ